MATVAMPRLSDSMEEGTIIRWLKADGDEVARGEEIAEIETDKATMAFEADVAGTLRILAAEGATVGVGEPIASIGPAGERPAPAAPLAPPVVAQPEPAAPRVSPPIPTGVSASPVALRAAASLGVDLLAVAGSGARGRILKADVVAAANGPAPAPAPAPAAPITSGAKGQATFSPLSRLQQTVARRMSESRATVPDFAIEVDVDMTEAVELRARMKELPGTTPSLNDLVVKATARTLRAHPRVNGSYRDGAFQTYERVNVGVAVSSEDGLVVPTVFDADRLGLTAVADEIRRLAVAVRDGTVTPPELAGGTFTVSNLGMFGIDRFAGVINPPQAAILCVGAVRRRPAVGPDGELAARELMTLTLVSDHRILYGADAARFLADLRATLEAPLIVLV
jgi:pyruvate dehydrogenase E2 component (dihydrolipoamide acetyltransferase)